MMQHDDNDGIYNDDYVDDAGGGDDDENGNDDHDEDVYDEADVGFNFQ